MNALSTPRRQASVWLHWIGQSVSFIALCFFGLAAIILIVVPFVTGSQTYSVLTSSMAPKYPPGTFLVVKPTDVDQLQVGDVVTYQLESGRPEVITHRITGFTAGQDGERMLITQGDNNDVADPDPVRDIQVRGELSYAVPYVGFAANALGNASRGSFVTVLAVGLIAWGGVSMVRGFVKDRRRAPEDGVPASTDPADTAEGAHLASPTSTAQENR